jgi:hypothetical protein
MRQRLLATSVSALVLAVVVGTLGAGLVEAATPLVKLTLSVAPTVAAPGTSVTYTGTITPVRGTPRDVRVDMEGTAPFTDGSCHPASHCAINTYPTWTYATLTSNVTITFTTPARPGSVVTLFLQGGTAGCSGTCPPKVGLAGPTITPSFAWTSSGQVIAGATLHVTVRARTNAGPVVGDLHVDLPAGVDTPTNLPAGAMYAGPPSHYIDNGVSLANAAEYSFDVAVNAVDGTTLTFVATFFPNDSSIPFGQSTLKIKVGVDTTRPTATGPSWSLASGTAISSGAIPVKLAWTGADTGSGVEHYQLAQSTDGHAWSLVDASVLSASTYRYLAGGHTYRFRVKAVDHAGNVSASWAYGSTFSLSTYSEASSTIHYGGTWATSSSSSYRGGKAKVASISGKTASRTFTGRSIAWLALKGPTKGKANVYVNGTLVATVDLYASTTQPQRLVWARNWSSSASRMVTIKVLGTSGRPQVNLDGLIILR